MKKNTEVLPTGHGTPNTPHQGGDGSHLNLEGVSLYMASLGGRGNHNTSATGRDTRWTSRRGGDCSGSTSNTHGEGGRFIGDEVRASEGAYKGGGT